MHTQLIDISPLSQPFDRNQVTRPDSATDLLWWTPLTPTYHAILSAYLAGKRVRKPSLPFVTLPSGEIVKVRRILSDGRSIAKLAKNAGRGYRTVGIQLLPHTLGSEITLCPFASPDCIDGCLNLSGRTMADTIHTDIIMRSRLARTILWNTDRAKFFELLAYELVREMRTAQRKGEILIVRGNVTSDIDWALRHREVVDAFPEVIWYGYTKNPLAYDRWSRGEYPSNYHLVFSRSEKNEKTALWFLKRGLNVTVVFDTVYSSTSKRPYRPLGRDSASSMAMRPIFASSIPRGLWSGFAPRGACVNRSSPITDS
jgi:hypothetical protein